MRPPARSRRIASRFGLALLAVAVATPLGFEAMRYGLGQGECLPRAADAPVNSPLTPLQSVCYMATDLFGPIVGYPLSHVAWRSGYLAGDVDFQRRLEDLLEPFDILVVKSGFKLTDEIIPGEYGHAALWLGSEAQLRDAGLWSDPALLPFWPDIRAGRAIVEATPQGGARLATLSEVANADRIAVVRVAPPADGAAAWRRAVARHAMGQLERPYDYSFDVDSAARLSCTEVVIRAFSDLPWQPRLLFGRRTVLPDDVLRLALAPGNGARIVAYFDGVEAGRWREPPLRDLAASLGDGCAP